MRGRLGSAVLPRLGNAALAQAVLDALLAERDRWALFLPVFFGAGIAAYFALGTEPAVWPAPLVLVVAGIGAWLGRRHPVVPLMAIPLALMAAGFTLAYWRAHAVAAPVLERQIGPVMVTARVLDVDPAEHGARLVLAEPRIQRLRPENTPARLRLTWRGSGDLPRPGQWVQVRATLNPPAGPAAPGAYDFARVAWFEQVGGTGFAVGRLVTVPAPGEVARPGWGDRWQRGLSDLRQDLTERILRALPGGTGAVAAALMTGERAAIPAALDEAYRDSGLAHLLSISGLHLALVAGLLFGATRFGLAAWEHAALHWPIKKWAAAVALLGSAGYLLLAGAQVPTQRSFLMTGLVLMAVLADRSALSPRGIALAAFIILAVAPEAIFGASFQMSFAAVLALIATWEVLARRLRPGGEAGLARRALMWLATAVLTSAVAGMATAPFAAYHFNRFVDFGLVANLVAVPLSSIWVMPWAVVAFLLMPFGAEWLALQPMGWGIDGINAIAVEVASWPAAVTRLRAMPGWSLPIMALGGIWLCLWRRRWRLIGLVPLLAGVATPWFATAPNVLIHPEGAVAVRTDDATLYAQGRGFVVDTWARRAGLEEADSWPRQQSREGALRCDAQGCMARVNGWLVALPKHASAIDEDCRTADVVVTHLSVGGRCPSARIVVDRWSLRAGGAHALWLPPRGAADMQTAADLRGRRPWSARSDD